MSEAESIMAEDRLFVKAIVAAFYDEKFATTLNVNEAVILILNEILEKTADCTEWFSYVPRPVSPIGPKPGLNWVLKQIRRIGKALIDNPSYKVSLTCKKSVTWAYRTHLEMASRGLL